MTLDTTQPQDPIPPPSAPELPPLRWYNDIFLQYQDVDGNWQDVPHTSTIYEQEE